MRGQIPEPENRWFPRSPMMPWALDTTRACAQGPKREPVAEARGGKEA